MRLLPLGVRGSTPAPGLPFVGYGGHTSAVAVLGDGETVPRLVLDAGTGLRDLPEHLDGDAVPRRDRAHPPALGPRPGAAVLPRGGPPRRGRRAARPRRLGHRQRGGGRRRPARPGDVAAALPDRSRAGSTGAGGSCRRGPGTWRRRRSRSVAVRPVAHKGGVTLGVRVELDGASVAYLPDHALTGDRVDAWTLEFVAGVDVLLHDGQFAAGERRTAADYGHATVEATLRLADRAGVGRLVLTHHAPGRTDEQLDALAARHRATPGGRPVTFARQGEPIDVVGTSGRRARRARSGPGGAGPGERRRSRHHARAGPPVGCSGGALTTRAGCRTPKRSTSTRVSGCARSTGR